MIRTCVSCGASGESGTGIFESGLMLGPDSYCDPCGLKHYEREAARRYEDFAGRLFRYADWSFDTYPTDGTNTRALELAKRWAGVDGTNNPETGDWEDLGINLYLYGAVGTGKTGLAWSIARYWVEQDIGPAHFVNVRELLAAARDYYSHGGNDPLQKIGEPQLEDLLVLDDLGAERPTDWTRETIATLVERRYQAQANTIVTSNYSPSQLISRLDPRDHIIGQRIVSRLIESCTVVQVAGPDRRLKAA